MIQTRTTLKAYFDNGDTITATAMADTIDSSLNLAGTTAQSMNSDLGVPNLTASNVSAQRGSIAGRLAASAATFTGRVRQGVSAAVSAANSLGDMIAVQETTVAATATTQVAYLPSSSNIVRLAVKVLAVSSGAAGGTLIAFMSSSAAAFANLGNIVVSAVGMYEVSAVNPGAYVGASGGIFAAGQTATAGANFIGIVQYYQRA